MTGLGRMLRELTCTSVYAALAMAAYGGPVIAETGAAGEAVTKERSTLEEIVVTARRREERLQDVPTAVTALTASALTTLNVTKTEDLHTLAAGLNVSRIGDRQRVYFDMRGQGQQNNGGEPGVQIYFDEIPLLRGGLEFFDLGQIEVLRGPQGTLFGRNTTGGAVRIRPRLPTFDFDGYIEARAGNLNARDLEGAINVPLVSDKVALRIAGTHIRRDGYVTNLLNGQKLDDDHSDAVRAQLLIKPNDLFEDRVLFGYRDMDANGTALIPNKINALGVPSVDAEFLAAYQLGRSSHFRQVRSEMIGAATAKDYVVENVASLYPSDGLTVRHIFGYVRSTTQNNYDVDGTPVPALVSIKRDPGQVMTNELQLLGTAFDRQLDWIVGGYYERSKTLSPGNTLLFNAFGNLSTTVAQLTGTSKALFAQGTYRFTRQLSLTAGLRETWDERNGLTGRALGDTLPAATNSTRFAASAPNWTVSLNYQPNEDLLLYVANRRGYKSGGINPFVNPPLPTGFGLEKLTDFELGAKSSWGSGDIRQRLNVAAFYGLYDQMQRIGITIDPSTGGLATVIYNAGKAHISGGEVELDSKFGSAAELGVQYAYLNVDFRSYTFFDGTSLPGQKPADSPKNKVTLIGTVYAPIPDTVGQLSLTAKYSYQSHAFFSEPNIVEAAQPAYSTVDFSLNWNGLMGHPIDASLFVQNATDKRYFIGQGFPDFAMMDVGPPRTYGVKVRYSFGASAKR